jgi:hypothetical protein
MTPFPCHAELVSASRLSLGFDLAFELDSPSVHHFVRHLKFTGSINAVYC